MMIKADTLALPGIRHAFFTRARRRLRRPLCEPQWRHRLARRRRTRCRKSRAHGGGARGRAAPPAHRLSDPFADVVVAEAPWTPEARPRADAHRHPHARARHWREHGRLRADSVCRAAGARRRRRPCRLARRARRHSRGDSRGHGGARRRARQNPRRAGADDPPAHYEVGPDLIARFAAEDPRQRPFFAPAQRAGHALFDLGGYVAARLRGPASATSRISVYVPMPIRACFSAIRRATHRAEDDYGRHVNAIVLTANSERQIANFTSIYTQFATALPNRETRWNCRRKPEGDKALNLYCQPQKRLVSGPRER